VVVSFEEIDEAVSQVRFVFDHEDAHALPLCHAPCKGRVRPFITKP
jgi:hypothetical protein